MAEDEEATVEAVSESKTPGRGHPRWTVALLIVGTLLTFIGIFSVWINRQALNTDYWVSTSGKLLANEDIQQQLSIFLSDELFANVNVEAQIENTLPPKLAPLAGPVAGGIQQLAPQVAQKALATPQVQGLWADANRAAHEALLKVVDGGGPVVSTSGGDVTLDLSTLVAQVGDKLGVGSALASKLPADAGDITILKSNDLAAAEDIAQLIRRLPIVLTLLMLITYGLAIYLAGPRRRQALRSVGIGFIVAGALVLIGRSLAGTEVVNALSSSESVRPAAQATWDIGTSLLVTVYSSAIAFGILVVIGAWIAGPTRLATALRREAAPFVREHRAGAYAAAGAVYLALIAWAPIAAFRKPFGILLFAVLLGAGAEVLRRQILRDHPEGSGGDLGARAAERVRKVTSRAEPAAAPAPEDAKVDRLERLASLHASGALTDEEFASAKAEALGSTSG